VARGRIQLEWVRPEWVAPGWVAEGFAGVNYAFAKQQHIRHPPYEEETTN